MGDLERGTSILFEKTVDWSFFNHGFVIPQSSVKMFCANLAEEVHRGSSYRIKLKLGEQIFTATLSKVGFSSNSRKQWQIRYTAASQIAQKLREMFSASYNYFLSVKNNRDADYVLNSKEYVRILPVAPDIFAIEGFPICESDIGTKGTVKSNEGESPKADTSNDDVIKKENALSGGNSRDVESAYKKWMHIRGKSAGTADQYATILRGTLVGTLKLDSKIKTNLFEYNTGSDFQSICSLILSEPIFVDINSNKHNSFSAAMNSYILFLRGDITVTTEIKLVNVNMPQIHNQAGKNASKVDFSTPEKCAFSDPIECVINGDVVFGEKYQSRNWRDLYVLVCEYFIDKNIDAVMSCKTQSGRLMLSQERPVNCVPRKLSNGMFLSVSVDIPNLVRFIGKVCVHCGVDLYNVRITYIPKGVNSIDYNFEVAQPAKPSSTPSITTDSKLDDIIDLEDGKSGIRDILHTHFASLHGYSNSHILWDAVRSSLALFLNDNAINTEDDLWRFMTRAFNTEYVLYQPHIWETAPTYPQSARGLIINLARQFGGMVTRTQINEFFTQIKIQSLYNAQVLQQELLIFLEHDKFILTEAIDPSASRCAVITKALDDLFQRENEHYILLRDIADEWFTRLPEINGSLRWTPLLLQEVIRIQSNSIGYRVIMSGLNGQALDTIGVAITPKKSDVQTFSDVVHRYCYVKQYFGKRKNAEELRLELRDAGMLDGNELIYNLHKVLDYRFAFDHGNETIKILER
ncbi:hypothetical protein FACS189490_03230 [Clostridia bacterium]|nr:hypothetical protein FACS189490_03230 [Clostridia bacterium]